MLIFAILSFRVVTYNILADCYADSDYSRGHLFSHCPEYALSWSYRKQLILDELLGRYCFGLFRLQTLSCFVDIDSSVIIGYHADIICLQEVDKKMYENDLKIFLECIEFKGTFDTKGEQMHEGLACCYNSSKFR